MKKILLGVLMLSLCGCDCVRSVKGIVLDQSSGAPLAQVAVQEAQDRGTGTGVLLTDENGLFEFEDISGGIFKCPEPELYFEKEGYALYHRSFDARSEMDTVYLTRE